MVLDKKLSFDRHLKEKCLKVNKELNFLSRGTLTNMHLPTSRSYLAITGTIRGTSLMT